MGEQSAWYVMRFLYNHRSNTRERLATAGIETFIPMRQEIRNVRGRKVRINVPVIRSLLFVRSTPAALAPYLETDNYFQFQYRRGGRRAEPLIVPDDQMEQFVRAVEQAARPLYFTPRELDIARGTRVRVLGGPFDGMEGVFLKVKGARSKRLVIELPDTLAVAVEIAPDLVEVLPE